MAIDRLQVRRGTATEWTTANPVLADGEPGYERGTGKVKYGDGVTAWASLPYASVGPQGVPGVADDSSVQDLIADAGSATRGELNATYASKGDGGYLLSCFRAASGNVAGDQALSIAYSKDGINFQDSSYGYVYQPATYPTNVVRDPSIMWSDSQQAFFICHTDTGATGTTFSIIKSSTLLEGSFTLVTQINVTTPAGVTATWAPEWLVDGADTYILVTLCIGGVYRPYWLKATNSALSTWTTPALLTVTGGAANIIDPTVIKNGSTYYMFYVDQAALVGGTPSIFRATATSPTGPYTTDKTGDWLGLGNTYYEGPSIIRTADGKYRLYLDRAAATTDMGYYYLESADLTTWGTVQPLNRIPGDTAMKFRHATILPITPYIASKIGKIRELVAAPRFVGKPPGLNQTTPPGIYPAVSNSGGNSYPSVHWANGSTDIRMEMAPNGELYLDKPGVSSSELMRFLTSRTRFGSAVQPGTYTTGTRPTGFDSSVAGATIWDSTIKALVTWNGANWVPIASSTARAQYNSSTTITSTSYTAFGLSVTFTPRGTNCLVRLDGNMSTVASSGTGLCNFRFDVTGGITGNVTPQGGLFATTTQTVCAVPGISTIIGGLTPGVAITITLSVKVDTGVTAYCRPSTNSYEFMAITVSDSA